MAKETYKGVSIVDYLKSEGNDSSFGNRTNLASKYGITDYVGSAEQNTKLLKTLRSGGATPTVEAPKISPTTNTTTPKVPDINMNQDEELNNQININQESDFSIKETSEEPEVRSKIEEQIEAKQPDAPDYKDIFEKYTTGKLGTQYQTSGLETELEDVNAMLVKESEIATARYESADKAVTMGVITGKVSEMEKQENVRMTALQNRATLIQDQLKTRYSLISNIMGFTKDTYEASKELYDDEYTRSADAIESVNKDLEAEQKDALSTWQTVSNLVSSGDIDYENMTAEQSLKIAALESKAGLPQGTLELIKASTTDKIVTTSISDSEEGKYAYVITQGADGKLVTTKMSLGAGTKTADETTVENSQDKQAIIADIEAITGKGEGKQYVDTAKIQQVRQNVAIYSPELLEWFDNAYKPANILNPEDKTAKLLRTVNKW